MTRTAAPYMTPLITPNVRLEHDPLRLVSDDFGDIYFSVESGLDETEMVFINGNDLPRRMSTAQTFTIAETGFGTGLNFLAVLNLWRRLGDDAPRLHYIATEIAPLPAEMIRAVLGQIPQLADDVAMMANTLPPRWPGRHRRHFCDGQVTLDLLYGDSITMIERSQFTADAWFLDGFAPAKNPGMWQEDLFAAMASHSAEGATIASFTAAGDVRRGLEDAGFTITRREGFGRKRHRITGHINLDKGHSSAAHHSTEDNAFDEAIVIIGAGIAGAALAAGLQRHGADPLIIGQGDGPHDGASGNIAAVQSPRLTADESFSGQLAMTCYGYARWMARETGASLADKAVIYGWNEREEKRQAKILAQNLPHHFVRGGTGSMMTNCTGLNAPLGGLIFDHGGAVDPQHFTKALLGPCRTKFGVKITHIEARDGGWQLTDADGKTLTTKQLALAGGSGLAALTKDWGLNPQQLPNLPFQVTAGRVSHLPKDSFSLKPVAMSYGGYIAQARDGIIAMGATFDKNINDDLSISDVSHEENVKTLPDALLAALRDMMPGNFDDDKSQWSGRMSYRIASKDRQPMAGRLGNGLYILTALGARGMVTGPLLGEYVASVMMDLPSPLDLGMASVVDPLRFSEM